MAVVLASRNKTAFIVDMPRSMPQREMVEFFAGVGSIKNGRAYDKRYNYKARRFDRPQVFLFTNVMPFFNFMSADRWAIYTT